MTTIYSTAQVCHDLSIVSSPRQFPENKVLSTLFHSLCVPVISLVSIPGCKKANQITSLDPRP